MSDTAQVIGKMIDTTLKGIENEVQNRAYRASNELRTASLFILRGKRSGRKYTVPETGRTNTSTGKRIRGSGVKYRASAPGEAPAVRTGAFSASWGTHVHIEKNGKQYRAVSAIESNLRAGKHLLGDVLEDGTERIAPRPYKAKVIERALPKIQALYKKPYKV